MASCAYFITGTDTEIGKTLVSTALLHALATSGKSGLRAAGMKPVAAGAEWHDGAWRNDDVERIAAAASVVLPAQLATPYLLREPASPHIAASLEGVRIEVAHIQRCYDQVAELADAIVVEGVGGFCVPLSEQENTADLAQQLGLPVIMVVGLRLGCINHACLTAEAIAARGLTLAGWVANLVDPAMRHTEANVHTLMRQLPAPLLGQVPRLPVPSAAAAAAHLDCSRLPGWPGKHSDSL